MALELIGKIKVGEATVEIRSDIKRLERQLKRFKNDGIATARYRASNRAANKAKTQAKRILAKRYNVKVGAIGKYLDVSPKASKRNSTVAIRGRSKQLSIYKYAKGAKRQTARGVRFNSGGGSKVHPHTFLAKMPNGRVGIYIREAKRGGRRPLRVNEQGKRYRTQLGIRELIYPSVGHMVVNKEVGELIYRAFTEDYPKQLVAQLDHALIRSKGGV